MSSSSSSSLSFSPPDHHLLPSSDQLCYVQCNFCDTVLAVSVPCSSLFKTVTVRCGHCTNLLSVNMRTLLLPLQASPNNHHQLLITPPSPSLMEEIRTGPAQLSSLETMNMMIMNGLNNNTTISEQQQVPPMMTQFQPKRFDEMMINTFSKHHSSSLAVNRPAEKRQRVPSAYNRFIKEEIQRIKAANPEISHREAFSAAAKNWAHFPHIHFGLMSDQQQHQEPVTKKPNLLHRQTLQDGDDILMKDGFSAAAAANLGVSPY